MNYTTRVMMLMTVITVAAGAAAGAALAKEVPHAAYRETGSSRDWVGIYSPDRGTDKPTSSCAIYSRPKSSDVFKDGESVDAMRGELAAFISWNGSKVTQTGGEVSFMAGLPLAEGAVKGDVVTIDGETRFDLVAVQDRLYVKPSDDGKIIKAIRGGVDMVVTARTGDGRVIKDAYSLLGVRDMTDISARECR